MPMVSRAGDDVIHSGDGGGTIDAGCGDDHLFSGTGSDILNGGGAVSFTLAIRGTATPGSGGICCMISSRGMS